MGNKANERQFVDPDYESGYDSGTHSTKKQKKRRKSERRAAAAAASRSKRHSSKKSNRKSRKKDGKKEKKRAQSVVDSSGLAGGGGTGSGGSGHGNHHSHHHGNRISANEGGHKSYVNRAGSFGAGVSPLGSPVTPLRTDSNGSYMESGGDDNSVSAGGNGGLSVGTGSMGPSSGRRDGYSRKLKKKKKRVANVTFDRLKNNYHAKMIQNPDLQLDPPTPSHTMTESTTATTIGEISYLGSIEYSRTYTGTGVGLPGLAFTPRSPLMRPPSTVAGQGVGGIIGGGVGLIDNREGSAHAMYAQRNILGDYGHAPQQIVYSPNSGIPQGNLIGGGGYHHHHGGVGGPGHMHYSSGSGLRANITPAGGHNSQISQLSDETHSQVVDKRLSGGLSNVFPSHESRNSGTISEYSANPNSLLFPPSKTSNVSGQGAATEDDDGSIRSGSVPEKSAEQSDTEIDDDEIGYSPVSGGSSRKRRALSGASTLGNSSIIMSPITSAEDIPLSSGGPTSGGGTNGSSRRTRARSTGGKKEMSVSRSKSKSKKRSGKKSKRKNKKSSVSSPAGSIDEERGGGDRPRRRGRGGGTQDDIDLDDSDYDQNKLEEINENRILKKSSNNGSSSKSAKRLSKKSRGGTTNGSGTSKTNRKRSKSTKTGEKSTGGRGTTNTPSRGGKKKTKKSSFKKGEPSHSSRKSSNKRRALTHDGGQTSGGGTSSGEDGERDDRMPSGSPGGSKKNSRSARSKRSKTSGSGSHTNPSKARRKKAMIPGGKQDMADESFPKEPNTPDEDEMDSRQNNRRRRRRGGGGGGGTTGKQKSRKSNKKYSLSVLSEAHSSKSAPYVDDITEIYAFVRELGGGISGSVHEVIDRETDEHFALKKIPCDKEWSEILFNSECKFLDRLNHVGIVRKIGSLMDSENFYILTELGTQDLFKQIKREKKIDEARSKVIVTRLLETLVYLHKRNVVHRDIKPENIVFDARHPDQPKFIDLADALIVKPDKVYKEVVGTPCYLSPERWTRHTGWELKASDIWAIGVLTYETVTGRRCFWGDTPKHIGKRVIRGKWVFPKDKPSDFCCHFIETLLTLQPSQRPSAAFCLKHPWLAEDPGPITIEDLNDIGAIPRWATYDTNQDTGSDNDYE